jgi:hypothetical protein
MENEYLKAIDKLEDISKEIEDEKAVKIIKDGSLKILELAKKNGLIIKSAKEKK